MRLATATALTKSMGFPVLSTTEATRSTDAEIVVSESVSIQVCSDGKLVVNRFDGKDCFYHSAPISNPSHLRDELNRALILAKLTK